MTAQEELAALEREFTRRGSTMLADEFLERLAILLDKCDDERYRPSSRASAKPTSGQPTDPDSCAVTLGLLKRVVEPIIKAFKDRTEHVKMLEERVAALEARPQMQYRGVWSAGTRYHVGNFVTDHGSIFYCRNATIERPGASAHWVLAVKRNTNGKDAQ